MEHSSYTGSDTDEKAARKKRNRSGSTPSKPMLIAQSSRKDIFAAPTPATSPAIPSTMLSLSTGRRASAFDSSSDADCADFSSEAEDVTRLLSTSAKNSHSSRGGILGNIKRRLSTSSKHKSEKQSDQSAMLTQAAISALSQQIDAEYYAIPSSIPELAVNSDEKLFTLKNIYFNLRRDLHAQALVLNESNAAQFDAQRKHMVVQLTELRNQHTRTEVLVSNVSRGGVYSVIAGDNSVKRTKELVKPHSDEDIVELSRKTKFCGCF